MCSPAHQYSVKGRGSSSSLNVAEHGHSGVVAQPVHHQLQTDTEEFQQMMGLRGCSYYKTNQKQSLSLVEIK